MHVRKQCPWKVGMMLGMVLTVGLWQGAAAQRDEINYDESKVPKYTLPDPLVCLDGTPVCDPQTWFDKRRPEILALFEKYVYGKSFGRPPEMWFQITSLDENALNGMAIRKEVTVHFTRDPEGPAMHILIYIPKKAKPPVPLFLGLNFYGNHTIHPDPGITLSRAWMRPNKEYGIVDNRATE